MTPASTTGQRHQVRSRGLDSASRRSSPSRAGVRRRLPRVQRDRPAYDAVLDFVAEPGARSTSSASTSPCEARVEIGRWTHRVGAVDWARSPSSLVGTALLDGLMITRRRTTCPVRARLRGGRRPRPGRAGPGHGRVGRWSATSATRSLTWQPDRRGEDRRRRLDHRRRGRQPPQRLQRSLPPPTSMPRSAWPRGADPERRRLGRGGRSPRHVGTWQSASGGRAEALRPAPRPTGDVLPASALRCTGEPHGARGAVQPCDSRPYGKRGSDAQCSVGRHRRGLVAAVVSLDRPSARRRTTMGGAAWRPSITSS